MNQEIKPQFYTPDEVAEILRIKADTVRAMCNSKPPKIPNYRVAKFIRIPRAEFERQFGLVEA